MINVEVAPLGHGACTEKAPGHWVLARLGKKVLRPGGLELTRQMLASLDITSDDDVVEFAPGLGATARITLGLRPNSYVAVERDEGAAVIVRQFLTSANTKCVLGRAEDTGLASHCATVVYGEAMLTMQPAASKYRIVAEAARLLAPGGRYAIHEVALSPETMPRGLIDRICGELSGAIHHSVMPLTVGGWRSLLEAQGFHVTAEHTAAMHLLEPKRLLADEGAVGAMRFAWNLARDSQSRHRVLQMREVFRKYRNHLSAVVLVGVKDAPNASVAT